MKFRHLHSIKEVPYGLFTLHVQLDFTIGVLNIFMDYAEYAGVEFYPFVKETIYCINLYNDNLYISLDDYFNYLKKAKVDELETIAQKLGAKHMKVTFKEQKEVFVAGDRKVKANAGNNGGIGVDRLKSKEEFSSIEVAAEVNFDGNETPSQPELIYFKSESDINALIEMRLDSSSQNKIKSKTYKLKRSKKYDMQENTALNIDVALRKLGCIGNASVLSKVQSEQRTFLEYTIIFRD